MSRGGLGLLWFNARTYDHFVLRLQFKTATRRTTPASSSASRTRARDPNVAIAQGHEVQIREGVAGDGEDQKTGSIYNFDREDARNARPAGEWNDYEIRYQANTYTITLNGTVVNTLDEHVHARSRARLHRPPEPRRRGRGLVPQRAHPGAAPRR